MIFAVETNFPLFDLGCFVSSDYRVYYVNVPCNYASLKMIRA